MLGASGLPSVQELGGAGVGGEGRGLGRARRRAPKGHHSRIAWLGGSVGSLRPASVPSSSGGMTVTDGDTKGRSVT